MVNSATQLDRHFPDVTVIIPVHNAEPYLSTQLRALCSQATQRRFEVIVVLNKCSDQSRNVAKGFSGQLDLVLLERNEKGSAAYARNAGAAEARAGLLLFCDADDEVRPDWIESMCEALARYDFVGGKVLVQRSRTPPWAFRRFYSDLDGRALVLRDGRILYPISASLGVRADAFAAVGGFDESFGGAAGEETNLALRLLRQGYRVGEAEGDALTYTPRSTFRSILRQQRTYALAKARLNAEELLAARSTDLLPRVLWGTRVLAYRVVRQRILDPRALAAEIAVQFFEYRAAQEQRREPSRPLEGADPDSIDFVVPVHAPIIGGLALLARRPVAKWYAKYGVESASLGLVERLLHPGDRFIDIGANIGTYSVAAAMRVGSTGAVISFEPDPRTRDLLRRNVERHRVSDWVEIRAQAVSREPGTASMVLYDNDVVSGGSEAPSSSFPGVSMQTLMVEAVKVDDVAPNPVHMLKIDVEGFEVDVLHGAVATIQANPNVILLVEINPAVQVAAERRVEDLLDNLMRGGRCCWVVEEEVGARPARFRRLDDPVRNEIIQAPPSWYANILSAPSSRQSDVERAINEIEQAAGSVRAPSQTMRGGPAPAQSPRLSRKWIAGRLPRRVVLHRRIRRAIDGGERELLLIRALLGRGHVMIDVGANRGLYTAVGVVEGAWVEVFEPLQMHRSELERIVKGRGQVHAVAVGTGGGIVDLHVPVDSLGRPIDTRASLSADANPGLDIEIVPTVRASLDSLVARADVIKIDVEGAEDDVLSSAARLLATSRPAILIEVERRHHDPGPIFETLEACGYRGFFLNPATASMELLPLASFSFEQYQSPENQKSPGGARSARYVNNFLFLPEAKLSTYREQLRARSIKLST